MGKVFDFHLLLALLLTALHSLQLSGASLSRQSKAQNGVVSMELWCVAKNNAEDAALQTALDWACGPGGADCGPIQQGGPCYDASDVQSTASFAFNSYYLKNGKIDDACNFDNTAALTSLNPSMFPTWKSGNWICLFGILDFRSLVSLFGRRVLGSEKGIF